jgi:hypothetical protein
MRIVAFTRVRLGTLLFGLGDVEAARSTLSIADEWFQASGGGSEAALATCLLAAIASDAEIPGAPEHLAAILNTARTDDDRDVQVIALDALARSEGRCGRLAVALDLLNQADEVMHSSGHRIVEHDRIDARRVRAMLDAGSERSSPVE